MQVLNIEDKKITIYDKYDSKNKKLPIIIYNSYAGNAESVFNECLKIGLKDFVFVVIENIDWDNEMTPYFNGPIFKGDSNYLGLASKHLELIEEKTIPKVLIKLQCQPTEYILSGYSLGGLFAIYAILNTTIFTKFVSCSGSLWYPNFIEYFKTNFKKKNIQVYLSLGNKEKACHDMSNCVEDKTIELFNYLKDNNIDVFYELNEGGHFKEPSLRIAKGLLHIVKID
jgi:predicted alpha/beta superfamily hydrolase